MGNAEMLGLELDRFVVLAKPIVRQMLRLLVKNSIALLGWPSL